MSNYFNKHVVLFFVIIHFSCVSSQERTIQRLENTNDVFAIWTDIKASELPSIGHSSLFTILKPINRYYLAVKIHPIKC